MSAPFDASLEWLRAKRGVKWARPGDAVIPAWVADMDFPVAPPVRAALEAVLDRGDLGYPHWPVNPLGEPFSARMASRYGWTPDPAHVRSLTDLIQAVQIVFHLGTEPGDGVIVHTPNYPPFLASIESMGRRRIAAPLTTDGTTWTWDHAVLEAAAAGARVLLLVNPHNPTGRAFTADELGRLAGLAERHDLIVVSDEIHAELTHDASHVPFASIGDDAAARTALAHLGHAGLRERWDALPPDLFGGVNVLGVDATPGVSWLAPEAGYLGWLDCPGVSGDPAAAFRAAGVELSPGSDFGPGNEHGARLNFATSPAVLDTVLDRLSSAIG